MSKPQPPPGSSDHYSDEALRIKLRQLLSRTGRSLAEKALLLYVIMKDGDAPAWVKAAIVMALGYLIWPADALPDPIPGLGLTDDLAILAALLASLEHYATPEHRERARQMMDQL